MVGGISTGAKGRNSRSSDCSWSSSSASGGSDHRSRAERSGGAGGQGGGHPQHIPHTLPNPHPALGQTPTFSLQFLHPHCFLGRETQEDLHSCGSPGPHPHLPYPFLPQPWTRWPSLPRKPSTRLLTRPRRLSPVLGKNSAS